MMRLAGFTARFVPLLLLFSGCNHSAPGRPARQRAPRSRAADASPPARAARDAGGPPLGPRMQDGCWSGLAPVGGAAAARLAALGLRCAPGMERMFNEPRVVTLQNGHSVRLAFRVDDPSKCLRAAAVSSVRASRVELRLLDPAGRELGRDSGHGWFSLLMPRGPVCVDRRGSYRLVVSARGAPGTVVVQVWRAR